MINRTIKRRPQGQTNLISRLCRILYILTVIGTTIYVLRTLYISITGIESTENDQVPISNGILGSYASNSLRNVQQYLPHDITSLSSISSIPSIAQHIVSDASYSTQRLEDIICTDPVWCNVQMPTTSSYKFFNPPTDQIRWKIAQKQAADGDLVLLREISKVFPNPFDFLDGDRHFRRLHSLIDIFIDEKSGIEALTPKYFQNELRRQRKLNSDSNMLTNELGLMKDESTDRRSLQESESADSSDGGPREDRTSSSAVAVTHLNTINGSFPWELEHRRVIPVPYNYRYSPRAPIIQLGYNAFRKDFNEYFSGNFDSGAYISRNNFITQWNNIKEEIDIPFITVCTLNENWGMLSTMVPNRTAKWGNCCDKPRDSLIYNFLNHPKTLMLAVNQHTNISHPKVLVLPRGIPLTWEKTSWIVWDLIRYSLDVIKKQKLLFASSSSWGPRPQILRCVSSKMTVDEFEGHDQTPDREMKKTKVNRRRYYEKLASARFGLSLPGLGYDTFRMWELLTMGSIVVIERGVGFDRTLWKLPALLIDDFADITPEMLRTAYVEALYYAKEFEFERLTQSFWWTVFANVSKAMSVQPLLDKFPMEAEEPNFARPLVPYECGQTGTCPQAKRIPKVSC